MKIISFTAGILFLAFIISTPLSAKEKDQVCPNTQVVIGIDAQGNIICGEELNYNGAVCPTEATCGNGVVEQWGPLMGFTANGDIICQNKEACDDGNTHDFDTCAHDCSAITTPPDITLCPCFKLGSDYTLRTYGWFEATISQTSCTNLPPEVPTITKNVVSLGNTLLYSVICDPDEDNCRCKTEVTESDLLPTGTWFGILSNNNIHAACIALFSNPTAAQNCLDGN